MLRDVRSNVTDGLLGFATATGDGLHIKIGVSPSVTEKPITILGSMGASTIKSKLGLSPLADAVMDAVQGGAARVFCIPVAASTAGTIGEVTKTGDGGGSVTVQGSPNNAYALTVRFTAQGGLNTAAFVYPERFNGSEDSVFSEDLARMMAMVAALAIEKYDRERQQ